MSNGIVYLDVSMHLLPRGYSRCIAQGVVLDPLDYYTFCASRSNSYSRQGCSGGVAGQEHRGEADDVVQELGRGVMHKVVAMRLSS